MPARASWAARTALSEPTGRAQERYQSKLPARAHGLRRPAQARQQDFFSDASFYLWRSKFGGMDVPDAKRLKLLAEWMLENETREALQKNF
jgi:hypothetical protein